MLYRDQILPEAHLPRGREMLAEGAQLAKCWRVEQGTFLKHYGVVCEADYKRQAIADRRIMRHAQIGYRAPEKSRRAWAEVHEATARTGLPVDRYGVCLDWTMGLPHDKRYEAPMGTGLVLDGPEDFARLANMAPVAPHFGDFVLGFPAAVETTQAALSAGATSIGNLGQYFTFRLPYWDDDVTTTEATVKALGLIAGQPVIVLVHSNLDDGFAGQFTDLTSVLGAAMLERYIARDLAGVAISHCWGHHFSDPALRLAFHLALSRGHDAPGTMIYGNTVSYRGDDAANFASLANYLSVDIAGQIHCPTGHAVNPVPVSENRRIPDIQEIIDAQVFAARSIELGAGQAGLVNFEACEAVAERIIDGASAFFGNVMTGLAKAGIDTSDIIEMMLALRRLGARRLENLFGAGRPLEDQPGKRSSLVASPLSRELDAIADARFNRISLEDRRALQLRSPKVIVATSDVHEHGKMALERVLARLGVTVVDGGVSVDADDLAGQAVDAGAEAIMVSTYNGVALSYFRRVREALEETGWDVPVLIGGRLNEIPSGSNTSLPVDVGDVLAEEGAIVCREIEDAVPALVGLKKPEQT